MSQNIYEGNDSYLNIKKILTKEKYNNVLIVCGGTFKRSLLPDYLDDEKVNYTIFDKFQPNPLYEDVIEGIKTYKENNCDIILSVGGGSAIDVAKCIKAYVNMPTDKPYVEQEMIANDIKHIAIPTTAGTGSESTHFAVMYYQKNKMSVADLSLLPDFVILEPSLLVSLPEYQKKSTLLDALCQATESYWSVKANEESRRYSKEAISLIMKYSQQYIDDNTCQTQILRASNLAGRAINITTTTLAHAMSYKITSMYGSSHGHAVAICMPYVWEYLANHTEDSQDGIKSEDIKKSLNELNEIYGCKSTQETIDLFKGLFEEYALDTPEPKSESDIDVLAASVNMQRMKNFPVVVSEEALKQLYTDIFNNRDHQWKEQKIQWNVYCSKRKIESLSKKKIAKLLGYVSDEANKKNAIESVGGFLRVFHAYLDGDEEIIKPLSELIIAVEGKAIDNEVDVINFDNAWNNFSKKHKANDYSIPVDKELQDSLINNAGITKSHAKLLAKYKYVCEKILSRQNISCLKVLLGTDDKDIVLSALKGLFCKTNLLLESGTDCEYFLEDRVFIKNCDQVIIWNMLQKELHDKKYYAYLDELHQVQLEMMDEIERVCKKNNLRYYISYGCLLGAIRHKGYIPWDDDLDICMPREDYDRFREIANEQFEKGCYLYNNVDYNDCWFSLMKVMKKDTVFVRHPYRFGEEDGQRVFIDVWPLDNVCGPEEKTVKRLKKRKSILTRLLRLKIKARTNGELSNKQKVRAVLLKLVSEKTLIKLREKNVTRWKDKETDYWLSGGIYNYIKETMPKDWYEPAVELEFEGHMYKFPGQWDKVLQHFYGNYMALPPKNKRFTHAPFKVRLSENGEELYFNEMNRHRRASFKTKLKRKIRKLKKKIAQITLPLRTALHNCGVKIAGEFRNAGICCGYSAKQLKKAKNSHKGEKCYIVADSSFLTDSEIEMLKTRDVFLGDNGYSLINDNGWNPTYFCAFNNYTEENSVWKVPVFSTKSAMKGRPFKPHKWVKVPVVIGDEFRFCENLSKYYYSSNKKNWLFMFAIALHMGYEDIEFLGVYDSVDVDEKFYEDIKNGKIASGNKISGLSF